MELIFPPLGRADEKGITLRQGPSNLVRDQQPICPTLMFRSRLANAFGQKIDPKRAKQSRKRRTLNEGRPKEDGLGGTLTNTVLEPGFNLGNYTWVDLQNVPVGKLARRKRRLFRRDLHKLVTEWDAGIRAFNNRVVA